MIAETLTTHRQATNRPTQSPVRAIAAQQPGYNENPLYTLLLSGDDNVLFHECYTIGDHHLLGSDTDSIIAMTNTAVEELTYLQISEYCAIFMILKIFIRVFEED